jgi:NitT/TauT family transport system substrate-binding protein
MIEGGGRLFLDERDLWPNGEFTTAIVIARTAFLEAHPDLVRGWLQAHVDITLWEQAHPEEAKLLANEAIGELTGAALPQAVLDGAWSRQQVTWDPLRQTILESAWSAYRAGYLDSEPDLAELVDLSLLNPILESRGLPVIP